MTEINELIKLADNEPRLLGALQELEQYRKNPLANLQPCWKYVRQNNYQQQLQHILQEIHEALEEKNYEKFLLECFDIYQGPVTLMKILEIKYGTNLDALFKSGVKKNTEREGGSYYECGVC